MYKRQGIYRPELLANWRVHTKSSESTDAVSYTHLDVYKRQGQERIIMDSPPGLEDVRPWLQMRDLLEQGGVRVPQVLSRDVEAGFLLLEDLGGPTLGQVCLLYTSRCV